MIDPDFRRFYHLITSKPSIMNPEKNKKIEEILGSLDGIKKAPAPDFFYTRLKAKMEAGLLPKKSRPLILRPERKACSCGGPRR